MNALPDKRVIKSFWWTPEEPGTRWFGELTLEHGCLPQLALYVPDPGPDASKLIVGKVVHGADERGAGVTLLHVAQTGWGTSGSCFKYRFCAGHALIGIAVRDASAFRAHTLCVDMQQLYGWLGVTGFDRRPASVEDAITIVYRPAKDVSFTVNADLEVTVQLRCSCRDGVSSQSIEESSSVVFTSRRGMGLSRCLEHVAALRLLLNFASLKPVYPVRLTAYNDDHRSQLGSESIRQEIELWTSTLRPTASEPGIPGLWLFRFEDFRDRFGAFFSNWLAYTVNFAEPLACYASTVYSPLSAELAHLSLSQALEAYHGVKFSSHHKQEFQAKITDLAKLHAGSLAGLIDDASGFAELVLCNRNYYTHHNPRWLAKGKVLKGRELIRMNEKLRLIFQMCVLSDLGIPEDRFCRLRRQIASNIVMFE